MITTKPSIIYQFSTPHIHVIVIGSKTLRVRQKIEVLFFQNYTQVKLRGVLEI